MLLFIFFYKKETLVIESDTRNDIYLPVETFELHWIHSIEKEEWYEVYKIVDQELLLEETYFKTFGAGVPNESDTTAEVTEDGFVKYTVNDKYPNLYLNVSDNVQTKIVQGDQEILLYEIYEPYTAVEISVEYIPLIKRILGGNYEEKR